MSMKSEHACLMIVHLLFRCLLLCFFLSGSGMLEPEFAEESFEELPETKTEDPATSDPSATYPGKGVYISLPYNPQLACLAVV